MSVSLLQDDFATTKRADIDRFTTGRGQDYIAFHAGDVDSGGHSSVTTTRNVDDNINTVPARVVPNLPDKVFFFDINRMGGSEHAGDFEPLSVSRETGNDDL